MTKNIIQNSDSYKWSHFQYYPPKTQHVYSYMESRGGKYNETMFFGLQGLIKEYLINPFSENDINDAKLFAGKHGVPFNQEGWEKLFQKYWDEDNQRVMLPIEIKAVPEGSLIPTRNVLMTIENTDSEFPWLTSFLETMLLRLWYPNTVATRIFNMKRKIKYFYDITSDTGINPFSLLDFSSRGCTSLEANKIGGSAYLIHFWGSDSIPAVSWTNEYYNSEMSGFSVPALEHSITTSWGDASKEHEMIQYVLENTQENGIVSLVGDTYNIFEFVEKVAKFKDIIVNKNITVVIRPDSGNPSEVFPSIIKSLRDNFGFTQNKKGYNVLNNVKILWGDGINEDTCIDPFDAATNMYLSADSIMIGSGGGLMQADIDRDTCKFAFKASNVTIDCIDYPIAKDPITDSGKRSKKGRMKLVRFGGNSPKDLYTYTDQNEFYDSSKDELRTVFKNGELLIDESIDIIRERANSYL